MTAHMREYRRMPSASPMFFLEPLFVFVVQRHGGFPRVSFGVHLVFFSGVHPDSICGPSRVHFGSILGPAELELGLIWGPFGLHLGSICVALGSTWDESARPECGPIRPSDDAASTSS